MSAKDEGILHETIVVDRHIKAPVETVFSAWESPEARVQWGPPSDLEAIEYLQTEFRVGGTDISRCGPKEDLCFRVESHYLVIQSPLRLVFCEHVSSRNSTLSASLISLDLAGVHDGTNLVLTIQIASLVGSEMIGGNKSGWSAAIKNLDRFLTK